MSFVVNDDAVKTSCIVTYLGPGTVKIKTFLKGKKISPMTNMWSPRPLSIFPIIAAEFFFFVFAKQRSAELWKQFNSVTRILKATDHGQYVSHGNKNKK